MHDGIRCLASDLWLDTTFGDALWDSLWMRMKWAIVNTSSVYQLQHKNLSGKNAQRLFKPSAARRRCEWHSVCTACFLVSPLGLALSSHIRRPAMRSQMIRWLYLAMVAAVCSWRCQVSRSTFGSKDGTRCHIHNSLMLMAQCGRIRWVFIYFFPLWANAAVILGWDIYRTSRGRDSAFFPTSKPQIDVER